MSFFPIVALFFFLKIFYDLFGGMLQSEQRAQQLKKELGNGAKGRSMPSCVPSKKTLNRPKSLPSYRAPRVAPSPLSSLIESFGGDQVSRRQSDNFEELKEEEQREEIWPLEDSASERTLERSFLPSKKEAACSAGAAACPSHTLGSRQDQRGHFLEESAKKTIRGKYKREAPKAPSERSLGEASIGTSPGVKDANVDATVEATSCARGGYRGLLRDRAKEALVAGEIMAPKFDRF